MACYSPIKGFLTPDGVVFKERAGLDILRDIELPCGVCVGCRLRRSQDWSLRVMHEAQMWPRNCAITLTYGEGCMPAHGSLDHRDFQLFLKRVRKAYGYVRFFMCGEYGSDKGRPHYHACIFNCDFGREYWKEFKKSESGYMVYRSEELEYFWPHGHAGVQDLVPETARYCAQYIMKKALGKTAKTAYQIVCPESGEIIQKRPEYAAMSLKPGIGAAWFEKFGSDVFPSDSVVSAGQEYSTPRYYSRLAKRGDDFDWDSIEFERQKAAMRAAPDNTEARLKVREMVVKARLSSFERNL